MMRPAKKGRLIEQFDRIRRLCLDEKHINCFLVEKDLPAAGYTHIQELVDLRLLHLVKSRVTVPDRGGQDLPGVPDRPQPVHGERKKRGLTILEFWKTGSEGELRRTALIYDPS